VPWEDDVDWIKLVIPLIAVAVWILSNLASQQKEARRPPRMPPLPPPRPRDPQDPLSSTPKTKEAEDKYRQELDRQREKQPRIPKPRAKRLEPVPKPPSAPPVRSSVPQPPRYSDTADKDQAAKIDVVVVEPVAAQGLPKAGEAMTTKPTPTAIRNLRDLVKTRDSLATAFLLREVLDLPVSKRPRRRM
jgi:hypothetical protein